MFKKHKQLIIGFVLGALLFSIVPVSATVQEYLLQKSSAKLIVDGMEFANKELPVLNYKGYNYLPAATFREVCNKIGIGSEWIGEKNAIQIDTSTKSNTAIADREQNSIQVTTYQKDSFDILNYNNKEYIAYIDIKDKLPDGYKFDYEPGKNIIFIATYERDKDGRDTIKSIVLNDIPHMLYERKTWIEYDYYLKNIASLEK